MSFWLALVGLLYAVFLPCFVKGIISHAFKKKKFKDKAFRATHGALFESYKEDKFETAAFEVVVLIKKFFTACSLVFFYSSAVFQLISLILWQIPYIYLLKKYKPYKFKKGNERIIKSEIIYTLGLAQFALIVAVQDRCSLGFYHALDWVCTFTFVIGMIVSLDVFYVALPISFEEQKKLDPKAAEESKELTVNETKGKNAYEIT